MGYISDIVTEFRTSDNPRHWFAYLMSHVAHMFVGAVSAAIFAAIAFSIFGEFPQKVYLIGACLVFWALYEILSQGFADLAGNFEDWVYLSIWGAGGAVFLWSEVSIGNDYVQTSLTNILGYLMLPSVHLIVGAWLRLAEGKKR